VRGTVQNASNNTTPFDFTIPTWAKRITVMYANLSTTGTNRYLIQIGSGGTPITTGYQSVVTQTAPSASYTTNDTTGFGIFHNTTGMNWHGTMVLTNLTGNTWVASGVGANDGSSYNSSQTGGFLVLSGSLNIVRLTGQGDTFNGGSVNILYEG
jgi:hypothetical protein